MRYNDKKIMIGLSGGINSMGVLCWLVESGEQPKELHLFYAHFKEHSPDTFRFVIEGIRYARKNFKKVVVKITRNSVLEYFRDKKHMIPHPRYSPCSHELKIEPMQMYISQHGITIDLIGYVKEEKKRMNAHRRNSPDNMFLSKDFPIEKFTDEWCFEIVKSHLGWYPAIYDIKDEKGKRIFAHNNCLPCKNMYVKDMVQVAKYFPEHMKKANDLSKELKAYWGRNAQDYYTEFGREDYEVPQCEVCAFD